MAIGMGRAFSISGQDERKPASLARVSKHWTRLEGRDFLIEEVPYRAISNAVRNLPLHASAGPVGTAVEHLAALEPLLPSEASGNGPSLPMQTAQAMPSRPGLVVDYVILLNDDSPSGDVFQSGVTYYISGCVFVSYPATFEGGAVIKFSPNGNCNVWVMNCGDTPFYFAGLPGYPTVFTAKDDNSVGETIDGSSGNPTPGSSFSFLLEDSWGATSATVAYAKFAYPGCAYGSYGGTSATNFVFQDCEFVQCAYDVIFMDASYNVQLLNDLFIGCGAILGGDNNITLAAQNITADNNGAFVDTSLYTLLGRDHHGFHFVRVR